MKSTDPVQAYFDKLPDTHKRQFREDVSGANFNFQRRLALTCELAAGSSGRLLDCAAGTGEITCALLKSGRFHHGTLIDLSAMMLQSAKDLLTSEIKNAQIDFVQSDVFTFEPAGTSYDLVLCLGLIAHTGRLELLLRHLKSMLAPAGRIILQSSLVDHFGTRVVRALTTRRELIRRRYRISWFSERDIMTACRDAGLQVLQKRHHNLGIPFADRISPLVNFRLEERLQGWSSRHGADGIYLLAAQ
jgi:ubiquinone/menaquinone biosynthesis C-methylase UbiE